MQMSAQMLNDLVINYFSMVLLIEDIVTGVAAFRDIQWLKCSKYSNSTEIAALAAPFSSNS